MIHQLNIAFAEIGANFRYVMQQIQSIASSMQTFRDRQDAMVEELNRQRAIIQEQSQVIRQMIHEGRQIAQRVVEHDEELNSKRYSKTNNQRNN